MAEIAEKEMEINKVVHTSLSPQAIVEADLKPRQSPASIASFSSSSSSPPLSVGFLSLFTHSVWSLLCCRQLSGAIGNYPKGKVALPWCCGLKWLWCGVGVALLWRVWLLHVVAIVADVPLYLCIVSFSFV